MRRRSRPARLIARAVVLSLVLLPLLGAAEAQSGTTNVHFYGHVFDVGRPNPMPMNTEFPAGEADFSGGYGGTCTEPDPTEEADRLPVLGEVHPSCERFQFNEAWFVSSAGFVDMTDRDEFDYAKLHNERGLTKNIIFDTGKSVTAVWYMSADAHGWPVIVCDPGNVDLDDVPYPPVCFNWDPGHLPAWQVEATLYGAVLGEHGGGASEQADIANAYNDGKLELIAQGVSTPQDITSLEAAGFDTVWKFDVDLGAAQMKEMPREMSLIWRVQWWSLQGGNRVLEDNALSWNVNSGEFYAPRITLPVKNAFDVELVLPQFIHGKLVIHGILNTPWGSYDVDPESVELQLLNGNQEVLPERIQTFADYSVAHGGHYRPVNVTYVWDYAADGAPAGDYDAIISAENHQGTASATCTARFRILENGGGEVLEVGRCGTVSEGAQEFAEDQTGEGGGAGSARAWDLPLDVLGDDATPVRVVPGLDLVAGLTILGLAALRRRWTS